MPPWRRPELVGQRGVRPHARDVELVIGARLFSLELVQAKLHVDVPPPYELYLKRFPAYLQQLEMESNGKHVDLSGRPVAHETVPVIWASPAPTASTPSTRCSTKARGSCRRLPRVRPPLNPLGRHQDLLVANLLAQTEALAFGRTAEQLAALGADPEQIPHRFTEGNRPTTTILAEELTPAILGTLVALYEHKVFVQGVIWGVDSFDQWGVELGKVLATTIIGELEADTPELHHDSSTTTLIERYLARRGHDATAKTGG